MGFGLFDKIKVFAAAAAQAARNGVARTLARLTREELERRRAWANRHERRASDAHNRRVNRARRRGAFGLGSHSLAQTVANAVRA